MRVVVLRSIWRIPNRPEEKETFSSQIRDIESEKEQRLEETETIAPVEGRKKTVQFAFFCAFNPPETKRV